MASPSSIYDSRNSVAFLKHPDLREETPSSGSGNTKYDVFLSFHGQDTRNKFTAHLYAALIRHGIPTFMDKPELPTGDVIDAALAQAINDSKIYIVVFSENYAYSPWCLNELLEIYKCYENMKRLIIGVYCGIDPSVVRHQTDSFKAAFDKHEEGRYKDRKELVNQWRTALTNVANLSGKSIPSQGSEADIIDEIIEVVLRKVNPKTLHVTKYPVGLDSVFKIVMPSLSSDKQEGVIKFGIYGMGGVGKTTLAKAIYNQLLQGKFNDSSFLADVRENSGSEKGLASLQEQLINDILKSKIYVKVPNVAKGIKEIEAKICSTKILVVIDDLDDIKQFQSLVRSFASGSVVIITTRDEQMLDYIKVDYRYKVNELDDAQSRTLFTKYAFEDATVNNSLMKSYSEDILHLAGGLPLALEVFGSYLSTQQSDVGWQSYIDKLQRNPNSSITQKLMISLDAVALQDPMLKQLFLDIACLFIGSKKDEAVEILETYFGNFGSKKDETYYAGHYIDILKKRCLLTLNSNDELRMHDLLRDMGREVARNGFPHNQPQNHSRLWMSEDISTVLTNETATEAIECFNHHDNVETYEYDMKTFTRMTKLRFLHLQGGIVSGNFTAKTFGDLRWLHWNYCPLTYVSSGFRPENIVILELRNSMIRKWESEIVFKKLKTIDMSSSALLFSTPDFNMFPCLVTLNLQGCERLKEFCIPVGSLKSLVSLNLCGCKSLNQLPDNLGNLTSLKKLNAGKLNVSKVPASIGNLNKLVELRLDYNMKLKSLPDSICNLKALEFLCIDSCTDLKELPKELGNMKSLKVLSAESLSVTGLPDSVGSLQKLVELYLSNSRNLARLPDNICQLRALEILHIDRCGSLESLPMQLGQMKSLKVINAEFLKVEELPYTIGHLNKLVELKLYGNSELTTLPSISNLSSLEILDLSLCKEVNILPDEIWKLPSLRELVARGTTLLKKLPYIERRQIPLMKLDVSSSGLTFLPVGFNHLSKLENLDLSGCSDLVSIPELPPNLESKLKNLNLRGCKSLEILPNVSDLKQLEYLDFTNCSGLMEIQGLEELTSLRGLHLRGCNLSLLGNTLTRRCFQLWSGFGHETQIRTPSAYLPAWMSQSPYWISGSSHEGSTLMLLKLLPNEPHNFLGIILCFKHIGDELIYYTTYSVKNTKSDFVWSSIFKNESNEERIMIVVPASIFSVRDDERIQVTANREIDGICLLYKTDEIEKVTPAPSLVTSAPSPLPIDSAPSPSSIESAPSPLSIGSLSHPPAQILSPSFESPVPTPSNDSNPAKSEYTEPRKKRRTTSIQNRRRAPGETEWE